MVKGRPDAVGERRPAPAGVRLWIGEHVAPAAPAGRSVRPAPSGAEPTLSRPTTRPAPGRRGRSRSRTTQRPSPRSSSSIRSGSMYSWWQSSHSPPGMPKHRRSLRSRQPERRVEPGHDEAATAAGAALAKAGHRGSLSSWRSTAIARPDAAAHRRRHDPTVPPPWVPCRLGRRAGPEWPGRYWTRRIVLASDQCFSSS